MAVFSGVSVGELSVVETCCVSEASGSVCEYGVNGECMVRGVIGGRSDSRPRDPRVSFKVS